MSKQSPSPLKAPAPQLLKLKRVELHEVVFVGCKNQGKKLESKAGLELLYCRKNKELHATFNNETVVIPYPNIVGMVFADLSQHHFFKEEPPKAGDAPFTPQVATPMSHVFAGEGHGKTGRDK